MSHRYTSIVAFVLATTCAMAADSMSVRNAAYAEDEPAAQSSEPAEPFESEEFALMGQCYARAITRVYVPRTGGQITAMVARGKLAHVTFPESVKLKGNFRERHGITIKRFGNSLAIWLDKKKRVGDVTSMLVVAEGMRLSVEVQVVDESYPASILDVIPLPNYEFERRKAEEETQIARTKRQRDASVMQQYRRNTARMLLDMHEVRAASPRLSGFGLPSETHYAPPGEARAGLTRIFENDGYRYLELILENRSDDNLRIATAYIAEDVDEPVPVDVLFQLPHRKPNQAIRELPADAPSDGQMRGMVMIPQDITAELGGLRIFLNGPPGMPAVVAKEVVELWPRMPEHIQRRRRWAKQIMLSARLLGGGYWMDLGEQEMPQGIEGTTMTGLGVRLSKGMHRNFVFEGQFTGGRSGAVSFSNVTWNGMTGDVARRVSFGRLQAMGAIRFGKNYLTMVRAGFGVQVANYNSTMTVGGADLEGPGDGFEIDGFFAAGLGFDARLGEHWLLGAGMTFAAGFQTMIRSLDVGIHAGYRWSLVGEDGTLEI